MRVMLKLPQLRDVAKQIIAYRDGTVNTTQPHRHGKGAASSLDINLTAVQQAKFIGCYSGNAVIMLPS